MFINTLIKAGGIPVSYSIWDDIGNWFSGITEAINNLLTGKTFADGLKTWVAGLFHLEFSIFGYNISLTDINSTVRNVTDFEVLKANDLFKIVKQVNDVVVSVALSLLVLFFLINMVQKAMEIERISWEKIVMEFVRFFIYKFLVQNALNILIVFLNITNNIAIQISQAIGVTPATNTIGQLMADALPSDWGAIFMFLVMLILWIVIVASIIGALVPIMTTMLKIIVCLAVAPIPIACGISDYGKGTARSFIMSVVALGIEMWIIIILTKIYAMGLSTGSVNADLRGWQQVVSSSIRIIFTNSLYAAALSWSSQKVQSMLGGN